MLRASCLDGGRRFSSRAPLLCHPWTLLHQPSSCSFHGSVRRFSASTKGGGGVAGTAAAASPAPVQKKREAAILERKRQGEALRSGSARVTTPFREVRESTQGAGNLMAKLLRPTSPSYAMLFTGLTFDESCHVMPCHVMSHSLSQRRASLTSEGCRMYHPILSV